MTRLLLLALAGLGFAAEPQLTSSDLEPLEYDLAASDPWMPLLWSDLRCSFAGSVPLQISAKLVAGSSGALPDASDLLALRDGYRLHLDGLGVQVAGAEATWSGPVSGNTELLVTTTQAIDAATAYLILRQLCYANCSGVRILARRRVEVRLRAVGGNWSLPLIVEIIPTEADTPPLLRYDPLTLVTDSSVDLLPQDWYDGRTPLAAARWSLDLVDGVQLTQDLGNGRSDASAALAGPLPWSDFSTRQLRVEAGSQTAIGSLRLTAFDTDNNFSYTTLLIATVAPVARLQVLGDFPFTISGPVILPFRSNLPDTAPTMITYHPDGSLNGPLPIITMQAGMMMITFDPQDLAAGELLSGTLVFTAQEQTLRLPYRILRTGTAQ
ncbi:MAG TPA: hypothetical protein DCS97_00160 [Planctomycetes bacterium]|nr:hypothetical protein [Planctomycetota bacterium]